MKLTEANVSKLVLDMIELKGNSYEVISLLRQINGKMDSGRRTETDISKNDVNLSVKVNTTEVDAAIEKAKELNGLLEKASSLLHELADMEINLSVNV